MILQSSIMLFLFIFLFFPVASFDSELFLFLFYKYLILMANFKTRTVMSSDSSCYLWFSWKAKWLSLAFFSSQSIKLGKEFLRYFYYSRFFLDRADTIKFVILRSILWIYFFLRFIEIFQSFFWNQHKIKFSNQ